MTTRGHTESDRVQPGWIVAGGITLSVVVLAALIGTGVRDSELLIANGRSVFVELGPRDPRSLIQGDYMRLRFRLPNDGQWVGGRQAQSIKPFVIGSVSPDGVATLSRYGDATADAGRDEIAMRVWSSSGQPILGTDGFFFAEGEAKRFEQARFGHFKVGRDGRVILVGLADEALTVIEPR